MSRRRHHEEHVNHEAWAIPYGDLITLLLAFFVVMYALSSVNEGKYRILSDSLVAAFRASPKSLEPIQVGELSKALHAVHADRPRTLVPLEIESLAFEEDNPDMRDGGLDWGVLRHAGMSPEELDAAAELIDDITSAIAAELRSLIDEELVSIRRDRYWLEIEINTSVLFATASAELSAESELIVRRLGQILAGTPTRIQVEGHTDSRPISTAVFPSNWELSAARAASVVRLFAVAGVEPAHMAAVGFGEFQPAADNQLPQGQAKNRRVIIVVMSGRDRVDDDAWVSVAEEAHRRREGADRDDRRTQVAER